MRSALWSSSLLAYDATGAARHGGFRNITSVDLDSILVSDSEPHECLQLDK
jgi:hypothetical protein